MPRLIIIIIILCLCLTMFYCYQMPTSEIHATQFKVQGYCYSDIEILEEKIQEQKNIQEAAHDMAEAARKLGYHEDHEIIKIAQDRWGSANEEIISYQEIKDTLFENWKKKRIEYPEATYVWEYLKNYGYNDYVCAGILGNIMVEVGGYTLDIQPDLNSKGYVGICQWSLRYYPQAKDLTLEQQCIFLTDTIESQFDTFAWIYRKDFLYNSFLEMKDCREAALVFAKVYERCSSSSYSLRQECAIKAYEYFIN